MSMISVVFTVYYYLSLYFVASTKHNIISETKLITNDIGNALEKISNDVKLISNTPPIEGIIRSYQNSGEDVMEQSTLPLWKKRLSAIFTAILKVNPYYTQIRYIGIADDGKEIVRVNRTRGEIYAVPDVALQNKGNRSYFEHGIDLARGSIAFMPLDYNQDGGKVTQPLEPTLRVLTPIYDEEQKIFGMIIINVNIENYISQIFLNNDTKYPVKILGKYGAELSYSPVNKDVVFTNENTKKKELDQIKQLNEDHFVVIQNIYADQFQNNKIFKIIVTVPNDKLSIANSSFLKNILLWLVLIAIIAIGLTYGFSAKIMSKLSEMAKLITANTQRYRDRIPLPVHLQDEVGMLARAFDEKTKTLENLASFDSLTGLPNRIKIIERIEEAILRSKRSTQLCVCLYIDINKFKQINDTFGHDYGDELLIKFSSILKDVTRESDLCGRLGGDEFVVVLERIETKEDLMLILERYENSLNTTFNIKGVSINNIISGGVAIYPEDGNDCDKLIKYADLAMFDSKKEGKGKFHCYFSNLSK